MEESRPGKGFQEITHTADLAMQVWGVDLFVLFARAALGMLEIMGITMGGKKVFTKKIDLQEDDLESLLVTFLSLILEEVEKNQIVYNDYNIQIKENTLSGSICGYCLKSMKREIKAVTFHDLKIVHAEKFYQTTLVFDI